MRDFKEEIRTRLSGLELLPARENEIIEELSQHLQDQRLGVSACRPPGVFGVVETLPLREFIDLRQPGRVIFLRWKILFRELEPAFFFLRFRRGRDKAESESGNE